MTGYRITFGAGIRRSLNESFKEAKARSGVVTSLPPGTGRTQPAKEPGKKRAAKPRTTRGGSTTSELARSAHDRIVGLTDAFCRDHLDDEYAALCRKLADVLARKRPSP